MRKVLIAMPNYHKYCKEGMDRLLKFGCEVKINPYNRPYTKEELKKDIADVEAVIADSEKWDEEAFQTAPKLRVIARFGTGMDSVDLEAAKRHGVFVTNCPGLNAPTVSEQACSLLLSMVRYIPQLNADAHEGKWTRIIFHELAGKTVGILGFGAIGQNVAKRLSGFDVNLIANDKFPNKEAAERLNVKMCEFDEVIRKSDYISIHLPHLPETHHIINAQSIAAMKDGVYIVNTARGPIVDEKAVLAALESGKIAGMASDVFEKEPVTDDNPLLRFPNFICTPHIAGETYENNSKTGLATATVITDVFEGKEPQNRRV